MNLIGTYDCKADAKGRVMFSSALKKQLAPVLQEGFVIRKVISEPYLEFYPMQQWSDMMKGLKGLNRFVKKNNDFIRMFTAGVKMVELDTSGRLLIPKDLCLSVGIKKDVVLSASVDRVEIWDKEKYEEAINKDVGDFAALAEEIMGKIDIDELS